ncbi:MAG: 50S ribosomal protein L6 [Pseudohongiellaceae bacterium]|nr:50S ribosomal protein L6 [Pseudohongiellaceae bacterium]
MSRVANSPVQLPKGVEATLAGAQFSVKGAKGNLQIELHDAVEVSQEGGVLQVSAKDGSRKSVALSGTFRALINNMVVGVSEGFQKKLQLQGVGYRAKAQGSILNILVGYSNPIDFEVPKGVTAETPSPTEIILSGADKQLVGQVAAKIRELRPPEPYKGKGIRYLDEYVYRKEAKKK